MSIGGTSKTPASKRPMSAENEPIIPLQVKYVEAQSATILKNRRVNSPAPILNINGPQDQQSQAPLLSNVDQSPTCGAESTDVSLHSPVLSPASGSPNNPMIPNKFQFDPNLSYAEKVAHEMIITEKVYLNNLKQIIDGFLDPVSNHPNLDVSQDNIEELFINVEEIYSFNRVLLEDMEECDYDPVKLAECFVLKQIGFGVYTRYCTHYPRSMEVLLEWNQREDTANFIKTQQETLGHTLPLCSFLLKPVQRILKYHLLLGNIAKHYKQSEDEEGFEVIQKALATMTNVAKHINDMKRKHEDAVHLQEIQSVLIDYEGPNLTSFGSLVLEDTFRLHGTKTGRYLLLFEKALLITKRRSDGTFTWKATVMFSNMMLADSVFREPLTFQVIPYDDRKICHTFVARNIDTKQVWLLELKRRLLDSYAAAVPMKAKQMILGNSTEDCEKENAEPESDQKSSVSNTRKGANQQRTHSTKDSSAQSGKVIKNMDNDRRKSREPEENFDEKSVKSLDTMKSPLRRLRVFKKRKFKDQGKPPKSVNWSSDENNDEPPYVENEPVSPTADQQDQDTKVQPDEEVSATNTRECDPELQENNIEDKDADNNDVIPMEPSLPDATTMTSVAGEDSDESDQVKLRRPAEESLPVKKRRLAKELRDKCKSMPFGEFLIDDEEPTTVREHSSSMSETYEKFTEELLSGPTSNKELQDKYGLVNLRENAHVIRTRRLGSYDEHMASGEGNLRRNPGMNNLTDEAMSKVSGDTSVTQTMKCVSAAFSDISPSFSPDKTPTSSTEQLNLTDPDEESDELGVFQEQGTDWDKEDDPMDKQETVNKDVTANNVETPPEYNGYQDKTNEQPASIWDNLQITGESLSASPSNEDEDVSIDLLSNEDKNSALLSERSSCADNLSDFYDDQDEDPDFPTDDFNTTYQRVFSLKRAYSEENLVSKCAFDEAMLNDGSSPALVSKSCTHVGHSQSHSPIMRSKSAEYSAPRCWSNPYPLTFSVTPKKKIVIKDSFWETIREDTETDHHERSPSANDGRSSRRRKKPKTHRKRSNKVETCSTEDKSGNTQHKPVICAYASLNIGDYRRPKSEHESSRNTGLSGETRANCLEDTITKSGATGDVQSEASERDPQLTTVTKVDVSLKKRSAKPKRGKSVVRVDANVSQVPENYVCIEAFPTDDRESAGNETVNGATEGGKTDSFSKVERLSKYFSEHKPETNDNKSKSVDMQNPSNIKQRVEEFKRNSQNVTNSEEKAVVTQELNSFQNIQDRIGSLRRRSASDETQNGEKVKMEIQSTLTKRVDNVKRLKNRIEENTVVDSTNTAADNHVTEEQLGNHLRTSLRIKDRIDELQHLPDIERGINKDNNKLDKTFDEELRGCKRIKDRIEKLQKEKKRELDCERDITISEENEITESLMSPRQNEELKTVVIKRGWVQQFIQKIETGS